jgi:predicted ATPase
VITRIEIDGFKSFVDFELNLEPFTVLAGANNSGKSNLLEAISLLRDLYPATDNAALARKGRGTGVELFHRADDGTGRSRLTINTYLADHGDSPLHVHIGVIADARQRGPVIAVSREVAGIPPNDNDAVIDLLMSLEAVITVDPHASAMRDGASLNDEEPLAPDCANLAAVIGRISEVGALESFVIDAAYVIGDLTGIEPIRDERRNIWDFDLIMKGGRRFTPSLVSDGTLRVLALLAALHDPSYSGTVLIEELENGLHPRYVERLCSQISQRVSNGTGRQVIATTHSPVLVADMLARSERSVVFLDQVFGPREIEGERRAAHWTRARRFGTEGVRGTFVSPIELRNYFPVGSES